ncbi:uncharacterized protein LOC132550425 [Ylistrum balloti]|uniref:uncharacterized protein LOC132550425 n=1 Tax=Ylistrum balloti TaxID=509963 RepID=UPI002905E5FE|nr:uncharacterized protein LOC132550425 [Ylistrum balloti]
MKIPDKEKLSSNYNISEHESQIDFSVSFYESDSPFTLSKVEKHAEVVSLHTIDRERAPIFTLSNPMKNLMLAFIFSYELKNTMARLGQQAQMNRNYNGDHGSNHSHNTSINDTGAVADLKSKTLHFELRFGNPFEDLTMIMDKSAIIFRGRGRRSKEVYVLMKPTMPFTSRQLESLSDCMRSYLKRSSSHFKNDFLEDEVRKISGRTPLEMDRYEEVYVNKNDAMKLEQQRLSSFIYWDISGANHVQNFVEAGFYCKDPTLQTVECFSCGLSLNVSALNGRHPLEIHRERSKHCQFLQSEHIRQRTFKNGPTQRFEPFTMSGPNFSGVNIDENEPLNPLSQQYEEKGCVGTIEDTRRKQPESERKHASRSQHEEKLQSRLSVTQPEHSQISQPSEERGNKSDVETDSGSGLLAICDHHVSHTTNDYCYISRRQESAGYTQEYNGIEGATAATTSSLTQDSSTPPPRNPLYEHEATRRETFNSWNGRHDIDSLIEAGLFYTGDQDIVRCFYCDIGLAEWNRDDDPWQEHARHSHECHFLLRVKGQAYVDQEQREWSKVYSPKRPELSDVNERFETYNNWPSDFVVQTPRQLAIAGFFFTGVTDTVRCHYCDGGLREWEPGDIPWVEHAKWFPHCKFVLKIKGLAFIQQCVASRNEIREDPLPDNAPIQNEALNRFMAPFSNEERYRAMGERNPMQTAAAQAILAMGYTTAVVSKCINEFISKTGEMNFEATDLMTVILEKEDESGLSASVDTDETDVVDDEFRYDAPALLKVNEKLKMEQQCIDCKTRSRRTLFQPCGHLLLCEVCAEECTRCVRCGKQIQRKDKVYLS